jgi:hypothetical protein
MRSEFVSEESQIPKYDCTIDHHGCSSTLIWKASFHGTEGASADAGSWTTLILLLHLEE